MASMNSSVLACSYAISGAASSELNAKLSFLRLGSSPSASAYKLPLMKAHLQNKEMSEARDGRRAALVSLAATLFATVSVASSSSAANAGVIEDYLEKSKANKV